MQGRIGELALEIVNGSLGIVHVTHGLLGLAPPPVIVALVAAHAMAGRAACDPAVALRAE